MKNDFANLTPQLVIQAAESFGFKVQNHFYQLNSYENRVFEVFVEDSKDKIILKAYRPNRWSKSCIQEEHDFLLELESSGVDVVPPIKSLSGDTILEKDGFFISIFKKAQGRMPQEFLPGNLKSIGSTLARLHNVGAAKKTLHRPSLNSKTFGWQALEKVLPLIPLGIAEQYEDICCDLIEEYEFESPNFKFIRIHGDCHKGNLLELEQRFFFVDFDDFILGPEAQDLWMLLDSLDDNSQLFELQEGYSLLRSWPQEQIEMFPLLKVLRIISYAAWLSSRWPNDPSFQRAFPHFGTDGYWWNELQFLQKIHTDFFI